MIVPSELCESNDFYEAHSWKIAAKKKIFNGNDKKLEKSVCIVYLLQPERDYWSKKKFHKFRVDKI